MKIPTKGRYAVAAMMDLALNEKSGPLTIADIAEKQNISLSYLEQLFADLRKNNLVKGTRGPGGGYRLARDTQSITVAEIIRAVEEKAVQTASEDEKYLPYVLWANLSQQVYKFLNNITLGDCIENPTASGLITGQRETTEEKADAEHDQFAA